MIGKLIRNPAVVATVVASAFYWLMILLLGVGITISVITAVGIGIVLAIVVRFWNVAVHSYLEGAREQWQQLQIAIVLFFSMTLGLRLWTFIWREFGEPSWMPNYEFYGFMVYLAVLGALLYLYASRTKGDWPFRWWLILTGVVAVLILAAGALFRLFA